MNQSVSVSTRKSDRRCKGWASIIKSSDALPPPDEVNGANDIPVPYSREGDAELLTGDAMVKGEANHHVKNRGWSYVVVFCADGPDGATKVTVRPDVDVKAAVKASGVLPVEYLRGAGDVAACVRIVHALRAGWRPA